MTPSEGSVEQVGHVNASNTAFSDLEPSNIFEKKFYDRELRHDRYLDSIIEHTLDELGHSDDIMTLTEIDFFRKREIPDTEYALPYNRAKEWAAVTDIDLAVIDLDNKVIGTYEVKPNPQEGEKAWEQLKDFRDHVQVLNEEHGMGWRVTGHVVSERHLREEYRNPNRYEEGIYHQRGLERGREEKEFQVLEENLFRGLEDEQVFRNW